MNRTHLEALAFAGELPKTKRPDRTLATRRRREFQQEALARGVHPATGSPLLADSVLRCRDCTHCVERRYAKKYWKCENASLSRSEATDIRTGWPACTQFEPRPA